jgi:hypothetical protein
MNKAHTKALPTKIKKISKDLVLIFDIEIEDIEHRKSKKK